MDILCSILFQQPYFSSIIFLNILYRYFSPILLSLVAGQMLYTETLLPTRWLSIWLLITCFNLTLCKAKPYLVLNKEEHELGDTQHITSITYNILWSIKMYSCIYKLHSFYCGEQCYTGLSVKNFTLKRRAVSINWCALHYRNNMLN